MTQNENVKTPAETYFAAFAAVVALPGVDCPKLIRLGELCANTAVTPTEQLTAERDALFAELFDGRPADALKLGNEYVFCAGVFGLASR